MAIPLRVLSSHNLHSNSKDANGGDMDVEGDDDGGDDDEYGCDYGNNGVNRVVMVMMKIMKKITLMTTK